MSSTPAPQEPLQHSLWRSGSRVIMRPLARLPRTCFRCGASSHGGGVPMVFRFHSPALYLVAVHPFAYLVARLAVQRRERATLPLCRAHRLGWLLSHVLAWGLVPVGVAATVWGLLVDSAPLALLGLYVSFAAGAVAALLQPAHLARMDDHFIHLRGAHPALLDQLDDWDAFETAAQPLPTATSPRTSSTS